MIATSRRREKPMLRTKAGRHWWPAVLATIVAAVAVPRRILLSANRPPHHRGRHRRHRRRRPGWAGHSSRPSCCSAPKSPTAVRRSPTRSSTPASSPVRTALIGLAALGPTDQAACSSGTLSACLARPGARPWRQSGVAKFPVRHTAGAYLDLGGEAIAMARVCRPCSAIRGGGMLIVAGVALGN